MLTFSCFTFERDRNIPNLTFIVTTTLERARLVARKELLRDPEALAVEICDGQRLLCTEVARP